MFTYYKQQLKLPFQGSVIEASLAIPRGANSILIVARGGDNDDDLEDELLRAGYGLLIPGFEAGGDLEMMTARLVAATEWLIHRDRLDRYAYGYLGMGDGAAAAIQAADILWDKIGSVVCRNGDLNLVSGILRRLNAPVLLFGEDDKAGTATEWLALHLARGAETVNQKHAI